MRPDEADPHVEENLAPSRVDHVAEVAILLCAEAGEVAMRPPQQALDAHATPGSRCKAGAHCRCRTVAQPLVVIAPPVGEVKPIPLSQALDHLQETPKVGGTVDQDLDAVAGRP